MSSSSLSTSVASVLAKDALSIIPKSRLASLGQWVVTATLVVSIAGVVLGAITLAPYILVGAIAGFMASAIAFYAIHKWKQLKTDEVVKGSLIEKIDGLTSVKEQLEAQVTQFQMALEEITKELCEHNEELKNTIKKIQDDLGGEVGKLTESNRVLEEKINTLEAVNKELLQGIKSYIASQKSLEGLIEKSTASFKGIQEKMEATVSLQQSNEGKQQGILDRFVPLLERLEKITDLQEQNKKHITFLEILKTMPAGKKEAIQEYLNGLNK